MVKVIITQKLQTLCEGHAKCNCPSLTEGLRACAVVHLANAFVTETNPVSYTMGADQYSTFLTYCALASLRREV
jgi:hypothetical protein